MSEPNVLPAAEGRRLAALAMSERDFQRQVVEMAKACGWLVAHFRPGMTSRVNRQGKPVWVTPMQGDPGFFDLVLSRAKPPRLIFAELKREKANLTPAQKQWQESLEADGCRDWEVYVWWPSMMEEIMEVLK